MPLCTTHGLGPLDGSHGLRARTLTPPSANSPALHGIALDRLVSSSISFHLDSISPARAISYFAVSPRPTPARPPPPSRVLRFALPSFRAILLATYHGLEHVVVGLGGKDAPDLVSGQNPSIGTRSASAQSVLRPRPLRACVLCQVSVRTAPSPSPGSPRLPQAHRRILTRCDSTEKSNVIATRHVPTASRYRPSGPLSSALPCMPPLTVPAQWIGGCELHPQHAGACSKETEAQPRPAAAARPVRGAPAGVCHR